MSGFQLLVNESGGFDEEADCPERYLSWQCPDKTWRVPSFGVAPVAVATVSSTMSVVGAIFTIAPYLLWKDVRTGIRRIITFLALADLLVASSYLVGTANSFVYRYTNENEMHSCQHFFTVCEIQSFLSCWFSMSSFLWTAILALYLYRKISTGGGNCIDRCFPLMHIVSWILPVILVFPLLATGCLGYSVFAAGGWCFVKADKHLTNEHGVSSNFHMSFMTVIIILVGGKAIEISTYVWVLVLFCGIYRHIHKKSDVTDTLQTELVAKNLLRQVEKKLYAIPFVFIILRIWGTLQFILSTIIFSVVSRISSSGCLPPSLYYIYYVLAIIQSIGDGGQGWCNFLLYVLWSQNIRVRMILNPCRICCLEITKYFGSSTAVSENYGIINEAEGDSSNSSIKYRRKIYLNEITDENETSPLLD